jgi:hypothetical protein
LIRNLLELNRINAVRSIKQKMCRTAVGQARP